MEPTHRSQADEALHRARTPHQFADHPATVADCNRDYDSDRGTSVRAVIAKQSARRR